MSKILCLNKNYIPIRVTSIYNAIGKLYCGLAEAIIVKDGTFTSYSFDEWLEKSLEDTWPEDQKFIQAVKQRIAHPSVIRYINYEKIPKVTLKLNRISIYSRDDYTCYICGKTFGESKLSIDHIVPLSRNGKNSWENMISCCKPCNWMKGDKLLSELNIKPKFTAYKPNVSNISRLKAKIGEHYPSEWSFFGV